MDDAEAMEVDPDEEFAKRYYAIPYERRREKSKQKQRKNS